MLKLNSVMMGSTQAEVMVEFYTKVFGKPADMQDPDNGFWGWNLGGAFLGVLNHSEMTGGAKDAGRVMVNFETAEVKEEFSRIKAFGGKVIHLPYEMGEGWVATLADPDGNYFQLMTPMG